MNRWRLETTDANASPTDAAPALESPTGELPVHLRSAVVPLREPPGGMEDPWRLLGRARLTFETDDGLRLPVSIDEQNAAAVLEVTHRVRERVEHERAGVPAVYQFGGESLRSPVD